MVSACSYSGAYPDRLRAVRAQHRGRAAPDVRGADRLRLQPLPPVRHRRDPQVLQLLPRHPDARAARRPRHQLGADRRGRRARLLRGHAVVGHPLRGHRRPAQRGPPLHVPGAPRCPDRHRPVAGRPAHPVRRHGPAAGPPGDPRARRRAGRGGRRGRAAGRAPGVRQPGLPPAALVRPAARPRRHPARLRPDPADHAAPVRSDVARTDPGRPGRRAAVRVLAARRRAGAGEPAQRLRHRRRTGSTPAAPTPPPSGASTWTPSRWTPRPASGGRSSPPRSTTR